MSKPILVTGATGKQGGSVVDALLASPEASGFSIIAVTRDEKSASAQKLKAKSAAIKIVQGNLDDVPGLFKTASEITKQPIWGVFSVQVPGGQGQNTESEERQGKAMVDEALKNNISHFVYTSVERGGDEGSWSDPTRVPHFASKHRVELHLRDSATGSQMNWTILRPVAFMDNFVPGIQGKVFVAAWHHALGQKPLQMIATSDIGWFAGRAFLKPEQYKNKAIGLAGDDLTYEKVNRAFKNTTGQPAPETFGVFGRLLLWGVKELGIMFDWFKTDGYHVDIPKLRKINPELMTLEDWLRKESKYETK